MSNIFYDHLIVLGRVEAEIKNLVSSKEEREELWSLVDEIVNTEVFDCILEHLPGEHHEEFLTRFHREPHNESLLDFIAEKIDNDINTLLKSRILDLEGKILKMIKT